MKLQFSLATLLVCVTVLAIVAAVAVGLKVREQKPFKAFQLFGVSMWNVEETDRPPTSAEIATRMLNWGLPSLGVTLASLWAARRLKFHRHTEPPVGVWCIRKDPHDRN